MLAVDGYFAHLPPAVRRQKCEQHTDQLIQALLTGFLPRQEIQSGLERLAISEVGTEELLAQATWVYQVMEDYIRRALATDAETRDALLGRMRQAYRSLMPKLTASLLDQQSARPPPQRLPSPTTQ